MDYIDYGINNNNCNRNYIVYLNMIHRFLHNSREINSEFLFKLLKQTNLVILKLYTHNNAELKEDYFTMRRLILQSLEENNEE